MSEFDNISSLVKTDEETNINFVIDEDKLVLKSRKLLASFIAPLSLIEFKLLDTYLSKVNINDPSSDFVEFYKSDFEKLVGNKRIKGAEIEKITEQFFSKDVIGIEDEESGKKVKFHLFEILTSEKDARGFIKIRMQCSEKAKPLIFGCLNSGYIKYQLVNISKLRSEYSARLYNYLLSMGFTQTWKISIPKLKERLFCKGKTYDDFKYLNNKILKPACDEINAITNLKYEYEAVASGRGKKKTDIIFRIISIDKMVYSDSLSGDIDKVIEEDVNPLISLLSKSCNNEFTFAQIQTLLNLIKTKNMDWLRQNYNGNTDDEIYAAYLSSRYAEMNSRNVTQSRLGYLKTIIKNDKDELSSTDKRCSSFDIKDLEKFNYMNKL